MGVGGTGRCFPNLRNVVVFFVEWKKVCMGVLEGIPE